MKVSLKNIIKSNIYLQDQILGKVQWKMKGSLDQDNCPAMCLHIQRQLSSTRVHHPQCAWKDQDQLFLSALSAPSQEYTIRKPEEQGSNDGVVKL